MFSILLLRFKFAAELLTGEKQKMTVQNHTECETTYSGKSYLNNGQIISLITLNVIVMILNLIFNSAVIYGLVATKQLKNYSLKLILYLSINDCCLALITQTLFTVMLAKFEDCDFETIVQFFAIFFTHISAYIIALIGFDRYIHMRYLNRYAQVITNKRVIMILTAVVLLSLTQAMVYVLGTQLNFLSKAKQITVSIDAVIAISVFTAYIMTVRVVKVHSKRTESRDMLKAVDTTVTRTASRILTAIVICYIPYIIVSFTHAVVSQKWDGIRKQWLEYALILGFVLTYFNSFVNAIIFLSLNKKVKRYVTSVMKNRCSNTT
ncbi:melatonin receptor type 1C-like [Hydractinia symbiolongicarpus]|uniref:melatonin receptor type 1C-like n=1 Tax=Hydractinia symbiolongicarpus TaxID=13093 RepID=UPI00254D5A9B|nr:melatonin receptor type 1C-like [Hydractinia symbiolongicarpus]XP_057289794.1 melatonin receptor type 1C-like [Hydractinia symbiolongicarpus]